MGAGGEPRIDRLEDIVEELEYLEEAVEGVDHAEYEEDDTLRRATERSLAIIGEAAKALPDELAERHPDIPWSDMAGMRDLLVHAYHRVDPDIVWETIHEDALPLLPSVQAALDDEPADPS